MNPVTSNFPSILVFIVAFNVPVLIYCIVASVADKFSVNIWFVADKLFILALLRLVNPVSPNVPSILVFILAFNVPAERYGIVAFVVDKFSVDILFSTDKLFILAFVRVVNSVSVNVPSILVFMLTFNVPVLRYCIVEFVADKLLVDIWPVSDKLFILVFVKVVKSVTPIVLIFALFTKKDSEFIYSNVAFVADKFKVDNWFVDKLFIFTLVKGVKLFMNIFVVIVLVEFISCKDTFVADKFKLDIWFITDILLILVFVRVVNP